MRRLPSIAVKATALLIALIAAGVGPAVAPPAWADSSDDTFIATLDGTGVPYTSKSAAVNVGRSVCDQLHNGVGFKKVALIAMGSGLTPVQAGKLMSAAVGAYCPDEGDALHNWYGAGEPG